MVLGPCVLCVADAAGTSNRNLDALAFHHLRTRERPSRLKWLKAQNNPCFFLHILAYFFFIPEGISLVLSMTFSSLDVSNDSLPTESSVMLTERLHHYPRG